MACAAVAVLRRCVSVSCFLPELDVEASLGRVREDGRRAMLCREGRRRRSVRWDGASSDLAWRCHRARDYGCKTTAVGGSVSEDLLSGGPFGWVLALGVLARGTIVQCGAQTARSHYPSCRTPSHEGVNAALLNMRSGTRGPRNFSGLLSPLWGHTQRSLVSRSRVHGVEGARNWWKFGQRRSISCQHLPHFWGLPSISAKLAVNRPGLGRCRPVVGANSARDRCKLARCQSDLGQRRSNFARHRPTCGRSLPNVSRIRRTLARARPTSTNIGLEITKLGPESPKL